jgi:hypothetical protein
MSKTRAVAAVPAEEIVPNLYNESSDDEEDVVARSNKEDVVDDLTYDVYNLTACNYHPIRFEANVNKESVLKSASERATALLLKK